jgi:hypothetical protein
MFSSDHTSWCRHLPDAEADGLIGQYRLGDSRVGAQVLAWAARATTEGVDGVATSHHREKSVFADARSIGDQSLADA